MNRYDAEHAAPFRSIRRGGDGSPVNDGGRMANAALMALMCRAAAYTGKTIRWDDVLDSTKDLTPPAYEFGPPLPVPPAAVPGRTRFG